METSTKQQRRFKNVKIKPNSLVVNELASICVQCSVKSDYFPSSVTVPAFQSGIEKLNVIII